MLVLGGGFLESERRLKYRCEPIFQTTQPRIVYPRRVVMSFPTPVPDSVPHHELEENVAEGPAAFLARRPP